MASRSVIIRLISTTVDAVDNFIYILHTVDKFIYIYIDVNLMLLNYLSFNDLIEL